MCSPCALTPSLWKVHPSSFYLTMDLTSTSYTPKEFLITKAVIVRYAKEKISAIHVLL